MLVLVVAMVVDEVVPVLPPDPVDPTETLLPVPPPQALVIAPRATTPRQARPRMCFTRALLHPGEPLATGARRAQAAAVSWHAREWNASKPVERWERDCRYRVLLNAALAKPA